MYSKAYLPLTDTGGTPPSRWRYYLQWCYQECSNLSLLTELSSKMWVWLRR